ncbi:uncharacterized protein [Triticum aestivum]|uniref:uncharacterized protein n=1 Tax=Triticum aestivum TaxID=4565 RepID=UPI001D02228E|nr:uncharacterized protein LOC123104657 [Triticum aestivum]
MPESLDEAHLDLIGAEDGMLLFASVLKPRLYLWSMEAGPRGAAGWARRRVVEVELEPLLPPRALLDMSDSDVWAVGFAEGVSVIFLETPAGLIQAEQTRWVNGALRRSCPTPASALEHSVGCWPLTKPHARLSVAVRRRDQVASR